MRSKEDNFDPERVALLVADHVSAMLAYWDKNLVCRFANSAYMEWFGKKREEMVNKITIQELLGALYEKNLPYIKGVLQGQVQTFEREIPLPSGTTRHSLANYFPDVINGEVQGFFVHVADISAIKSLEAELNFRNKRLLNFANTVSHNLRSFSSNLAIILTMYEKSGSQEEREKLFSYLKSISGTFTNTIKNLGEIVEVENISNVRLTSVNLHQYVEDVITILKIDIDNVHATVLNNIDPQIIIRSNPAYIESVILNLLSNAIKYRHPSRPLVIELSSEYVSDELIIKIKDNGLGIDLKRHRGELFGMFKTFHGNADAKGVGLYITKFQIEALGGRIEVKSEVMSGTTFAIYLKANI